MGYGFRLYKLVARNGRRQKDLPFESLDVGLDESQSALLTASDRMLHALEQHRDVVSARRLIYLNAKNFEAQTTLSEAEATDESSVPYLRVDSVSRRRQWIDVTVSYGREAGFEYAMNRDNSEDTELKSRAPSAPYRVSLYLPESGTTGFMITETWGRRFAGESLLRLLNVTEQNLACDFDGEFLQEGPWLKWVENPLTDSERVREVVENDDLRHLRVRKHYKTRSGKERDETLRISRSGEIARGRRVETADMVEGWFSMGGTREEKKQKGAAQIAAIIGLDDLRETWDDGEIVFVENGQNQKVAPDKLEGILTYPLGAKRPDDHTLREASLDRLKLLAERLRLDVVFD